MSEIIFTVVNIMFTCISVTCAVITIHFSRKQTQIMQLQLEESQKPDFPTTMRLESIANAIRQVNGSIKNLNEHGK